MATFEKGAWAQVKRLSLYWYATEPNFGDAFSPMVVEHCFGCKINHGGKWCADIVAEGSVLDFALLRDCPCNSLGAVGLVVRAALNRRLRNLLLVWGSGMLFPLDCTKVQIPIRRPKFLALRGELTRKEMVGCGLLARDTTVALGDPGLFMPEVLGIVRRPTCRRGLVLHAYSWHDGTAAAFAREHPEILLIDPRRSPEEVVRDIAACAEVFSSSLHGLVAADALGIPNRWVALRTSYASDERNRFKFDDYYSAFGLSRTPCRLDEVASEKPLEPLSSQRVEGCKFALRESISASEW